MKMNLNGLADLHTHSDISYDGKNTPAEMCERAVELGLAAYSLTDHVECNFWYPREDYENQGIKTNDYDDFDYRSRFELAKNIMPELKERYKGRLNLLFGCEVGQAIQAQDAAEEVVSCGSLDFIIGSLHQVRKRDDFFFINLKPMPQDELDRLICDYYKELYELACWGKFDVMGHITYPLRYIVGDAGRQVDLKPCDEMIFETMKKLISDGKGIEINTSGLRQKYGLTFPHFEYVRMYRQLGGEILTLGSDSHCADDLGKGIAEGAELAKAAGFEYIAYFKNRRAEFIRI
ncbi:MAG: histidinol-phosphatase HisJ family protein [Oscillospiraceae bacterium]